MDQSMTTKSTGTASVELVSDWEVLITRVFHAPRRFVFEALTKPEHVKRWYGLRVLTMQVCEIDLRPGGTWRYVLRAPDGSEHGFTGVYREIVAPERIVSTENYEAMMPGHEMVVTVTLEEKDGRTTLKSRILYQSKADRDGHLQSGMEPGMLETFDRLAELLEALA
jgi:uncharacterized protein YndB with AHSA1/START domain